MRILFCNPPTLDGLAYIREGRCEQRASSFQYLMAPISLPSCAAVCRQAGHDVAVVDSIAENLDAASTTTRAAKWHPDLIVLAVTTPTVRGDQQVARMLREATGAHVTAIGIHVTALPDESLADGGFDSVVRGEPEYTVRALADALAGDGSLDGVEGLSSRAEGVTTHAPDRPYIENLDELPFPARDLLHNERYVAPFSNVAQTPVMAARGCPWECTYCTAAHYSGKRIRRRSAKSVVDEMQECVERFGIPEVLMWAETFLASPAQVREVCAEIRARDLKVRWICNSRVDTIDAELLPLMRDAGCWALAFGVESGSQAILDRVKKRTTLAQSLNAIRVTRAAGLKSMAHLVVGLPGESEETVGETIAFLRELDPDYLQVYCAVPFPGSDLYEEALAEGWVEQGDWSFFEQNRATMRTADLSAAEVEGARKRILRGFYLRPGYMLRQLGGIRSLEDATMLVRGGVGFLREWVLGND